nr:hypothetical protein [Tanacetum cinerariifolium]
SQTPKGIPVGHKMGFKPKHVFQPVSKKSPANTCGKKMNNSESTKEVSKSNPFEVLTSVDNDVDLGAGEKKTVKKPSQASRGVSVGPKMAFKSQKEYWPITKKPNTSSSGNKKKSVEPTIEVSNSNPFDVLNSVDNYVVFGTNRGTSNLGNNEANPSGSSFMNIDDDVKFASNTPIGGKIDKIERQIGEGKLRLLDSEVEVVYDDIANLMIPTSGTDRSDK